MNQESLGPHLTVTFEEAMAKLIGYEGLAVPGPLIAAAEKQPLTHSTKEALGELNERLQFCSLQDALLIRIECLKDYLKRPRGDDSESDLDDESIAEDHPAEQKPEDVQSDGASATSPSKTGSPGADQNTTKRIDGAQKVTTPDETANRDVEAKSTEEIADEEPDEDREINSAICKIESTLFRLKKYGDRFEQAVASGKYRIEIAPSPSGIRRYNAHSVASWARNCLGLPIRDWYDLTSLNLFSDNLPDWIDAALERRDAYFDVFDALMNRLCQISPDDVEGGNRAVSEWRGCYKNNGKINVAEIEAYIANQFDRIEKLDVNSRPKKDVFYDRINSWNNFQLSSLRRDRPTYTEEKIPATEMLIAGLIIGVSHDSYGEDLSDCVSPPWPVPEKTASKIVSKIERQSSETTRAVIERSISTLMGRRKLSDGA